MLPFANVGGDSAQEYFADGLTDELSTVLGKVPGVQITARSSAYKYKGRRDLDARSVGRALGAEYIVQGSVRREGDSIRVATQVTRSADNKEVWQDSYNGDARNVFALEDRMIKAVTAALGPRLRTARRVECRRLAGARKGRQPRDGERRSARRLHARTLFRLDAPVGVGGGESVSEGDRQGFEFRARRTRAWRRRSNICPTTTAHPRPIFDARVEAAANRALALDSAQAEAHVALGMMHSHAWEWDAAGDEFRRALALDPTDASAHTQYGRYLIAVGRPQEALTGASHRSTARPGIGGRAARG